MQGIKQAIFYCFWAKPTKSNICSHFY